MTRNKKKPIRGVDAVIARKGGKCQHLVLGVSMFLFEVRQQIKTYHLEPILGGFRTM